MRIKTDISVHVTIRTKEAAVPNEFPPARLYLDDIEEIVSILLEEVEKRKEHWNRSEENAKTSVTLAIKDRICDKATELREIAAKTKDISIKVDVSTKLPTAYLTCSSYGTNLSLGGFMREQQLVIFHRLSPIFDRRNRWLAAFYYSNRRLIVPLMFLLNIPVFINLFKPKYVSNAVSLTCTFLIFALLVSFVAANYHTVIILHNSSERFARRHENTWKIIPIIVSFLLGLLTLYLKQKYWP